MQYTGQYYLSDFEYLAGEMLKNIRSKDPSYIVPLTFDKYIPDI